MIKIAKDETEYNLINIAYTKFIDLTLYPRLVNSDYQRIYVNKANKTIFFLERENGFVFTPQKTKLK